MIDPGGMKLAMSTFGYDTAFLEHHLSTILLEKGDAKLLVCPSLQGRVMTSTASGNNGRSYGWINYALIRSGRYLPHCNNFGGEDRFWIGPEGGQFSVFFPKGAPFDLAHWQTPSAIDTEPWELFSHSADFARLHKSIELVNYSGTLFELLAERKVSLLDMPGIENEFQVKIPISTRTVGFKSINKITNTGQNEWNHASGMISIWILGQFIPSDRNTVIIPYNPDATGEIVNDRYFGKVNDNRMNVLDTSILFKGDGKKRGKIGIAPERVKPVIGSYDPINKVLTVVKFSFDPTKKDYVNSLWEHQKHPYKGDVINSYNDGPLPDGTIMGPFYELESSSAAEVLASGESFTHMHSTCHFEGEETHLDKLSRAILGISISECY